MGFSCGLGEGEEEEGEGRGGGGGGGRRQLTGVNSLLKSDSGVKHRSPSSARRPTVPLRCNVAAGCGADCGGCLLQLPLCYHPSIEYRLSGLQRHANDTVDVLFPGIVEGKPRRERIIADLQANGITVSVRGGCVRVALMMRKMGRRRCQQGGGAATTKSRRFRRRRSARAVGAAVCTAVHACLAAFVTRRPHPAVCATCSLDQVKSS